MGVAALAGSRCRSGKPAGDDFNRPVRRAVRAEAAAVLGPHLTGGGGEVGPVYQPPPAPQSYRAIAATYRGEASSTGQRGGTGFRLVRRPR